MVCTDGAVSQGYPWPTGEKVSEYLPVSAVPACEAYQDATRSVMESYIGPLVYHGKTTKYHCTTPSG
jgi:hypothetical protein